MSFKQIKEYALRAGVIATLAMPFALSCDGNNGLEGKIDAEKRVWVYRPDLGNYAEFNTIINGSLVGEPIQTAYSPPAGASVLNGVTGEGLPRGILGPLRRGDNSCSEELPRIKDTTRIFDNEELGDYDELARNKTHRLLRGAGGFYKIPLVPLATGPSSKWVCRVQPEEAYKMIKEHQEMTGE